MKTLLAGFVLFRRLIGRRFYLLIAIMAFAAIFEGLSVTTFLPILHQIGGQAANNPIATGMQKFLAAFQWQNSLAPLLIMLVVLFSARSALLFAETAYVGKIQADLLVQLRADVVARLFAAPYPYYLNKDVGFLTNAVTREFGAVSGAFKMYASTLVRALFVVVYLTFCVVVNPPATLMIAVLGLATYPIAIWINNIVRRSSTDSSSHSAQLQSIVVQSLNNFKYFKATAQSPKVLRKIFEQSSKLGAIVFRTAAYSGLGQYALQPVALVGVCLILYLHFGQENRSLMDLAFVFVLLQRSMSELLGLQQNYRKYLECIGSIEVFTTLQDELHHYPPYRQAGSADQAPLDIQEPIVFDHVVFRYNQQIPILEDVSLLIAPKSTVAFVGLSGAGKSTLANLLTGILTPDSGRMLLGQSAFTELDLERLRSRIGYITQETVIFNDTFLNNVTLWDAKPDMARFWAACQKAQIKEFVERQPAAFNTLLGDNGIRISGGQRQRIAIARELYKQLQMIIFDEATSSLDSHTESLIQTAIDELHGEMTVVLIAHRLSTVKNSDMVFVLKDGRVVESGSYKTLAENGPEFRSILAFQKI